MKVPQVAACLATVVIALAFPLRSEAATISSVSVTKDSVTVAWQPDHPGDVLDRVDFFSQEPIDFGFNGQHNYCCADSHGTFSGDPTTLTSATWNLVSVAQPGTWWAVLHSTDGTESAAVSFVITYQPPPPKPPAWTSWSAASDLEKSIETEGIYNPSYSHHYAIDNAICIGLPRYGSHLVTDQDATNWGVINSGDTLYRRFRCDLDAANGHAYRAYVNYLGVALTWKRLF